MEKNKKSPPNVDLTKISNLTKGTDNTSILKAIEKAKELQKKQEPKKEVIKTTSKFSFVHPSIIDLPSGGKFYDKTDPELSKGKIKILPITLREEEILSTERFVDDGVATIMVLDNCIQSNVKAEDLLLYDYTYLLFYLKKISYQDEHTFTIQCNNPSCGNIFETGFKISDLTFNEVPEEMIEPYKVDLPQSGYTVVFEIPRVRHLKEYEKAQFLADRLEDKEFSGLAELFSVRTLAIVSKDGEEVPRADWRDFFKSLPTKDRHALTEESKFENGISKIMETITCPICKTVMRGGIPITDELFRFTEQ